MGLLIAGGVAALVLTLLWWRRIVRGAKLQLVAAALLIATAGYTLQGQLGLTGSPAAERPIAPLPPVMPMELTAEIYGRFSAATPWLIIANGYMSRGDSVGAIETLRSALRANPRSSELWISLANAMVIHNAGRPSPASELAFARSAQTAPDHPGPPFFYGLMLLQQGQIDPALRIWREALGRPMISASWRERLSSRIAIIERLRFRP